MSRFRSHTSKHYFTTTSLYTMAVTRGFSQAKKDESHSDCPRKRLDSQETLYFQSNIMTSNRKFFGGKTFQF